MLDPNRPIQRAQHPIDAPLNDAVIMLDPQRGKYYELNRVAGRIWELLAQPTSINGIVSTLQQEFEIAPETCEAETKAIVGRMMELGIVVGV